MLTALAVGPSVVRSETDVRRAIRGRDSRFSPLVACGITLTLLVAGVLLSLCGRSPQLSVALPDAGLPSTPVVARDRYTGFVLGPKASVDSAGRVWLAGFVFRPTRVNHMVDATVTGVAVQCSYSPEEYERLFRPLESLVTFTADAASAGNMELTSCPVDARPSGNSDLGR